MRHFGIQRLSNTAWAFATLNLCDSTLLDAIASSALKRIQQWRTQELVNTVWAFSKLGNVNQPLLEAISS